MSYNYATFPLDLCADEFEAFAAALPVGSKAPGGTLVDAATGESVELSELWLRQPVMLEFGSFT